ncbi:hypothetical protein PG991_006634 [Apiospora marii]|uniref:Uncharacterized protein n=1 Tax=Apiospora marii TaxID=335849 RepID=A0ABR1RZP8_9PEZI
MHGWRSLGQARRMSMRSSSSKAETPPPDLQVLELGVGAGEGDDGVAAGGRAGACEGAGPAVAALLVPDAAGSASDADDLGAECGGGFGEGLQIEINAKDDALDANA